MDRKAHSRCRHGCLTQQAQAKRYKGCFIFAAVLLNLCVNVALYNIPKQLGLASKTRMGVYKQVQLI